MWILNLIWYLYLSDEIDRALDVIYQDVEDLLLEGQYNEIDEFVKLCITAELPPVLILGILIITAPWDEYLPSRSTFIKMQYEYVLRTEGEKEANSLFRGVY